MDSRVIGCFLLRIFALGLAYGGTACVSPQGDAAGTKLDVATADIVQMQAERIEQLERKVANVILETHSEGVTTWILAGGVIAVLLIAWIMPTPKTIMKAWRNGGKSKCDVLKNC